MYLIYSEVLNMIQFTFLPTLPTTASLKSLLVIYSFASLSYIVIETSMELTYTVVNIKYQLIGRMSNG